MPYKRQRAARHGGSAVFYGVAVGRGEPPPALVDDQHMTVVEAADPARRFAGQLYARFILKAAVQQIAQRLRVAESVMCAGRLAVFCIHSAAVEQPVLRAGAVKLKIALRRLGKHLVVFCEQTKSRLRAVGGAAAPIAPLVRARAPAVIPRAVRQHKVYVRLVCVDRKLKVSFVIETVRKLGKRRQ